MLEEKLLQEEFKCLVFNETYNKARKNEEVIGEVRASATFEGGSNLAVSAETTEAACDDDGPVC